MSASSGNSGWAQLRQQARQLETQTETLFHTYSQFASAFKVPPKPTEEERETERKLEELIEKRDTVISQLTRLLDSEPALASSASKQSNLSVFRRKLSGDKKNLTRLRSNLQQARNETNLLTNIRTDINEYRESNPEVAEADYMLEERNRIDNSNNMTDNILSQAYAVNDSFNLQRETLASINRRITHAASQVPGINTLIGRISAKKRRDGIIMGSFVAFCFIVFFLFS